MNIFEDRVLILEFLKVRPWAAKKGIQLMQEAYNYSVHLNDEDFIRLTQAVEKCNKFRLFDMI